jgi:hypothetical protein
MPAKRGTASPGGDRVDIQPVLIHYTQPGWRLNEPEQKECQP